MSIPGKILAVAAGAALFAAGYVSGCAGATDRDYRILRDKDRSGFEHVYIQDRNNSIDLYEMIKTDDGIKFQDYNVNVHVEDKANTGVS
ncbi:MAG: hypothetical protein KKE20_00365, partial [Nanoarchaeota archaeon]|nr:hypothetical protein [Nanoarchaeota archaeon]